MSKGDKRAVRAAADAVMALDGWGQERALRQMRPALRAELTREYERRAAKLGCSFEQMFPGIR
jgi:hypothetical protein